MNKNNNPDGSKVPTVSTDKKIVNEIDSASTNSNNNNNYNNYQNQPFKCLANSIEPRFLLCIIQERLESHKKVDINATTMNNNTSNPAGANIGATGANTNSNSNNNSSKVKCLPSARTINCPHHCVAILATRLFALLCNEQTFQHKLMNQDSEICFNLIIDILYPNNDPVRSYNKR